ncbi:hypothetical protein EMIHUDRAFT_444350 [Emiliania huxleyi CCMP1516]|uniref:Cyclin N-terminal domain-containing protein n=2 Tax=Emiliania huxleyi TaxID=2903 RepID=A0A0D3JEK4_EMIH1|nr:hypothetical protein EMIHUDRAFT_444350 [Emiliania huxleyi CCMP1516]EOD21939.1 hypothetical protein EMIHUDRAFT_444350 [Emiliania huxleyi CCMP1516]|eukprot:XP_005774368.1 hypothetical protein EMIHUDRAFT_444350 [Emiliania huxleyi CCMP1516]
MLSQADAARVAVVRLKAAHTWRAVPRTARLLSPKDREDRVEKICEVTEDFCLQPQTAGLAVSMFDRVCAKAALGAEINVPLDVVGLVCVLVATKFQEVRVPAIEELAKMDLPKGRAPRSRILMKEAEMTVLCLLDWDLHEAAPHQYLEHLFQITGASKSCVKRAEFFVDMSFYEARMLDFSPIAIAAGSLMLAWQQLGDIESENKHTAQLACLCEVDLKTLFLCRHILMDHFESVFKTCEVTVRVPASAPMDDSLRSESPDSIFAPLDAMSVVPRPPGSKVDPDKFFSPLRCPPSLPLAGQSLAGSGR